MSQEMRDAFGQKAQCGCCEVDGGCGGGEVEGSGFLGEGVFSVWRSCLVLKLVFMCVSFCTEEEGG
jgi:hypothetical protein